MSSSDNGKGNSSDRTQTSSKGGGFHFTPSPVAQRTGPAGTPTPQPTPSARVYHTPAPARTPASATVPSTAPASVVKPPWATMEDLQARTPQSTNSSARPASQKSKGASPPPWMTEPATPSTPVDSRVSTNPILSSAADKDFEFHTPQSAGIEPPSRASRVVLPSGVLEAGSSSAGTSRRGASSEAKQTKHPIGRAHAEPSKPARPSDTAASKTPPGRPLLNKSLSTSSASQSAAAKGPRHKQPATSKQPWSPPPWDSCSPSQASPTPWEPTLDSPARASRAGPDDEACSAATPAAPATRPDEQQGISRPPHSGSKPSLPRSNSVHLPSGCMGSGHMAAAAATAAVSGNAGGHNQSDTKFVDTAAVTAEAAALRQEVAQLRQLLGIVQGGPDTQHQPADRDRKGSTREVVSDAQAPGVLACLRAQIWQQQRQIAVMAAELQAHTQLTVLAEGVLKEVEGHMDMLIGAGAAEAAEAAHTAPPPHQMDGVLSGLSATGELTGSQVIRIASWAKDTRRRLNSERAHIARKLNRNGLDQQQQQQGEMWSDQGAAPSWQVPWVPVGGNRYLAASMAVARAAVSTPNSDDVALLNGRGVRRKQGEQVQGLHQSQAPTGSAVHGQGVKAPGRQSAGLQPEEDQESVADASRKLAAAAHVAASCTVARMALGAATGWLLPPSAPGFLPSRGGHLPNPSANPAGASLLSALAAMPEQAHDLEGQLRQLVHQLGSLAVLLRTLILPAMPWLSIEAGDRLQVEVAETSQSIASAANSLAQVTSLLPGGPAVLTADRVAAELQRRGKQVEAGRDSWLYAAPGDDDAASDQGGAHAPEHLDLDVVVGAVQRLKQDSRAWPHALRNTLDMLLARPLEVRAAKLALLESELKFCCRSVAFQAQHVQHLMRPGSSTSTQACSEARSRSGAACNPHSLHSSHAQALDRVVAALEQLDRQPSEASLAALVTEMQVARPSLLAGASALWDTQSQTHDQTNETGCSTQQPRLPVT